MAKELVIEKVGKRYLLPSEAGGLKVLEDISFEVEQGEIIAILGPSGCGKSTLLNIVAGFEKQDSGRVLFMGEPICAPSPQRGVVFQSAVLFPWLTVYQNVAYGLKLQKRDIKNIKKKCGEFIKLADLEGFENYYPDQLSGGMQQRVALARVLVLEPRMLLMDEPFAALDAQTRTAMQQLLLSITEKISSTILFVTHDIEEALILADKVFVMSRRPGRITRELIVPYSRPRALTLIGSIDFSKMKNEIMGFLFDL